MVEIKTGLTQAQSQLFAIGASIIAHEKAKKKREEIQKENEALVEEYIKTAKCKNLDDLSKAILADGQSDPKWPSDGGAKVGYQKAIKAGSPGAAGYNAFRSWCAKWYTEDLRKKTPEELKEEKGGGDGEPQEAGETVDPIAKFTTEELIGELTKRAEAGDAIAKKVKFPKI